MEMSVCKHVTPLIVILLLTVLFVGVVTIHPTIPTAAPYPLEGAALKYQGISYTSWAPNEYTYDVANSSLDALKSTGANYASVLVTQYVNNSTSNTIFADPTQTPTDAAVVQAITVIHGRGMGVMLKPQLLCVNGSCGQADLAPTNLTAWFASYATLIDHYAQIAQNNGVELFCIGCELDQLDTSNYANWSSLISGVRAIYTGPLTYASEWFDYTEIPFWNLLDIVGVDAYFPLSNAQTPSVTDLVNGWSHYDYQGTERNWAQEIETWQTTVQKPVIFTEIGYQSADYAAKAPGNFVGTVYNAQAQANCYAAALQVFANKPWFAGMFWWNWFPDPRVGGAGDTTYTPQNKPAQSTLTAYWNPLGWADGPLPI